MRYIQPYIWSVHHSDSAVAQQRQNGGLSIQGGSNTVAAVSNHIAIYCWEHWNISLRAVTGLAGVRCKMLLRTVTPTAHRAMDTVWRTLRLWSSSRYRNRLAPLLSSNDHDVHLWCSFHQYRLSSPSPYKENDVQLSSKRHDVHPHNIQYGHGHKLSGPTRNNTICCSGCYYEPSCCLLLHKLPILLLPIN